MSKHSNIWACGGFFFNPPQSSFTSPGFPEDCAFQGFSFSAHFQLWVSAFAPIYFIRHLLWWWLNKALIYKCSRISFRVILLLSSFRRRVLFGFPIYLWFICCKIYCLSRSIWIDCISLSGPEMQSHIGWSFIYVLSTMVLVHFPGRLSLYIQMLVGWCLPLFTGRCRASSNTMNTTQ